jgi:hypothetical protein
MKRLWRFILNGLTVLALVLSVTALTMMVADAPTPIAYWSHNNLVNCTYFFVVGDGRMRLVRQAVSPASSGSLSADTSELDIEGVHSSGEPATGFRQSGRGHVWHGFQWQHTRLGWSRPKGTSGSVQMPNTTSVFVFDYRSTGVPYWFPALAGFVPLTRLIGLCLRRYRLHLVDPYAVPCPVCNYDLRSSPDRCPECGTMPAVKK